MTACPDPAHVSPLSPPFPASPFGEGHAHRTHFLLFCPGEKELGTAFLVIHIVFVVTESLLLRFQIAWFNNLREEFDNDFV